MVSRARLVIFALVPVGVAGCTKAGPPTPPPPAPVPDTVVVEQVVTRVDTVTDPETRKRLSQMEADLLSREARIQVLEEQLDDARREVVRTMARSQTVASKAEAASGIAEAELALRTLKAAATRTTPAEVPQVERLLHDSNSEFDQAHFGGALYLASQARTIAVRATDRIRRLEESDLRPGETTFEAPLRLQTTTRANVRDGPSTSFRVLFTLEAGSALRGVSYSEGWVRIADEEGRTGWIARSLVERRD